MQEFPASVAERIGHYVYVLIDPNTSEVFYVGKGAGNRIFAHVNEAIEMPRESDKLRRIRDIKTGGQEVKYEILRHGLTEKEAFEVEAAIIDFIGLPVLTNEVTGHDTVERGRMAISDVIAAYRAEPIAIGEPAILIIVNKLFERNISPEKLYEITRGNWVIGERRNQAKYAFAVYNEVVREVYRIKRWFPVKARSAQQKSKIVGALKVK